MSKGIDKLILENEDIIMISDLDEIPDPQTLTKIKNSEIEVTLNYFEQDFYYYNLNTKSKDTWRSSRCFTFKKYKELQVSCDEIRIMKCEPILKSGWHLSYFGDPSFIINKIKVIHQYK
jgi:beta-1,4-mannosyl-glycoprotein beta-1,4-N-acetylglucosaminyltransferase